MHAFNTVYSLRNVGWAGKNLSKLKVQSGFFWHWKYRN